MKLEFKLDELDFLDFQLFTASQSHRINRKLRNSWIFLTLCFGITSALFFSGNNVVLSVYFGIIAIICGLFYPRYFRWKYKKHYKTHIQDNYSNRFGKMEYIEIKDEVIFVKEKAGEGTINISEIEKIDETEKYFFVKINIGTSLIIPKYKIINSDEVRNKFKSLGFTVNEIASNKWI